MKYMSSVALGAAMVWLVGCASAPRVVVVEPLGPVPTGVSQGRGDGSLVIYSARVPANVEPSSWEWGLVNVFEQNELLNEPAHTGYTIYTRDGKVLKYVRNAHYQNGDMPTPVALAAGSYTVEAEGINCDSSRVKVLMVVVIEPGQTTLAHLEGNWQPAIEPTATGLAKLPCGRAIGWSASDLGYASTQQAAVSN